MIRVAVVEDSLEDADKLLSLINSYGKETGINFETGHYSDASSFLKVCENKEFNIVFMDIEMPGMDGLSCAAKFRETHPNAPLIFVTNMAQFAIKGYEVNALDFVVKPIEYFSFKVKIEKALKLLKSDASSKMVKVSGKNGAIVIKLSDVVYIESDGHFVVLHTKDGEHRLHMPVKDAEKEYSPYGFQRVSGSFIANLAFVREIKANEVKVDKYWLPLSRSKKKEFLDAFAVYVGGRG